MIDERRTLLMRERQPIPAKSLYHVMAHSTRTRSVLYTVCTPEMQAHGFTLSNVQRNAFFAKK